MGDSKLSFSHRRTITVVVFVKEGPGLPAQFYVPGPPVNVEISAPKPARHLYVQGVQSDGCALVGVVLCFCQPCTT